MQPKNGCHGKYMYMYNVPFCRIVTVSFLDPNVILILQLAVHVITFTAAISGDFTASKH